MRRRRRAARRLEPLGQGVDRTSHVGACPSARGRRSGARLGPALKTATRFRVAHACAASAPTQHASGSASTARARVDTVRQRHERAARHGDVLGEDVRPVHPDQLPRRAEVVLAGEAARARAAAGERIDGVALAVDAADGLVAEDERRHARPRVAAVAVQVGAADARQLHVEHDLVAAGSGSATSS